VHNGGFILESTLGLFLSILYIAIIIAISTRLVHLPFEFSRTFTHILVMNWWFIASFFIKDYWLAVSAPVFFVIFNTLNVYYNWIPSINTKRRDSNMGPIFYALAVLLLTIATFHTPSFHIVGGIGLLVMAYGDGFAALIGQKYGKHTYTIFKGHKTLEGSLTMFLVSMIVIATYQYLELGQASILHVLLLSVVATFVEAISPHGLDNLFIPILVSLLYFIMIL
jgi:phytol kinase